MHTLLLLLLLALPLTLDLGKAQSQIELRQLLNPTTARLSIEGKPHDLQVGQTVFVGDRRVQLESLRGKQAVVQVSLAPSVQDAPALLQRFGLTPVGEPEKLQSTLGGGPATPGYEAASQAIGMDLKPLLGKNVQLLKYTRTKTSAHGFKLTVFLAVHQGRIYGAWQCSDNAPVAPGILPLSSHESEKW